MMWRHPSCIERWGPFRDRGPVHDAVDGAPPMVHATTEPGVRGRGGSLISLADGVVMPWRRRWSRRVLTLLTCAVSTASCSATGSSVSSTSTTTPTPPVDASVAGPTSTSPVAPAATVPPDGTTVDTAAPSTVPQPPAPLAETNQFEPLSPGTYVSDLLSLELEVTTTIELNVTDAEPGTIIMEAPSSTEGFTGVGFMVVDTLVDSDVLGRQRSRLPATAELGDFLESRDGVDVVDRRDDELGGRPARVWRIEYTEPCDECFYETLFNKTGWLNSWGTLPGYTQELWTVDAPGSPIVVAVEAPDDGFDAWRDDVQRHLFDRLRFGPPTGFSLQRPTVEPFSDGFGEYAIGRTELEVVDTSRPTIEVRNDIGVVVPASDERRLLLSVAYPSEAGGFGAAPADGSFPLVVVAPALRDAAIALPADRQLASHGFVVVTVRFPESSYPGNAVLGVPQQPADVSFVIDELQRGALPDDLTAATDLEHIGLIGHSGGATTAFGVLAYECCQDERVDAVVAHGGTPYDFESSRIATDTPMLHVVSNGDVVAPVDPVREFHEMTDGPSSLAVLEFESHLAWLAPEASSYGDVFDLVLAFVAQHLRGTPADLASLIEGSAIVELDQH
jgi:hypothetical protein